MPTPPGREDVVDAGKTFTTVSKTLGGSFLGMPVMPYRAGNLKSGILILVDTAKAPGTFSQALVAKLRNGTAVAVGVIDGDETRRQSTEEGLGSFKPTLNTAKSPTANLNPAWLDKGYQLFVIVPRTPESPEGTLRTFAGGVSKDADKNPALFDSMKRALKK